MRLLVARVAAWCRSFVRTLVVIGVFTVICLLAYVTNVRPSNADCAAYVITVRDYAYDWPLCVAVLMACLIDYCWHTGTGSVVMGNVVQRGGTIDASIGKTTISW